MYLEIHLCKYFTFPMYIIFLINISPYIEGRREEITKIKSDLHTFLTFKNC